MTIQPVLGVSQRVLLRFAGKPHIGVNLQKMSYDFRLKLVHCENDVACESFNENQNALNDKCIQSKIHRIAIGRFRERLHSLFQSSTLRVDIDVPST